MKHGRAFLTVATSSLLAIIILLIGFMPQMAQARALDQQQPQRNAISYSPSPQQGIAFDLQSLLDATTDLTDTDGDGLPDSVEWVLGTDPENVDSDFDTLDDYYEAANGLDPLKADSNSDGLPDNLETKDVAWDFDNDSIPNVWDPDNDNDGVPDNLDRSPFAKSILSDSFHFDIQTNGNPTYVDFQIQLENTEHLKLPFMAWDWPYDTEGQMQDRDSSQEDVQVYPFLELSLDSRPEKSELDDYGIGIPLEEESTGGFKVHGITTARVDETVDWYNKEREIDLTLFGENNSSESGTRGYIIGYDVGYFEDGDIAPYRWSTIKDVTVRICNESLGTGTFYDIDSNSLPELFLPGIAGVSVYQVPLFCGVDVDNFGNTEHIRSLLFPGNPSFSFSGDPIYSIGSGLDIADIDGNGAPDLLAIFLIEGTNELACLIGWNLEKHTYQMTWPGFDYVRPSDWSYSLPLNITNPGCSLLSPLPSFNNNITNISVKIADINNNGSLDLVLMGTDSGANQLNYRIGWDLDDSGIPINWSEIKTSPQIGAAAAGGGATIADIDGNDTLDMLLLAVDNAEKHDYHYTIGWDIDDNGNPLSWSNVKYYSDAYHGFVTRGITVGDIDGNGNQDLVLLGGDDAADPNRAGYIIGWDFAESDSLISPSRWSPIKNHPYYFDFHFGAAAFTDLNGNGEPEIYIPSIGSEGIYSDSICFGVDLDAHGDQQNPGSPWDLNSMWAHFSYSGDPVYSSASGLDIADIDGNGVPDLLATFLVEGSNELAYVIGWNLETEHSPPGVVDVFGLASSWSYSSPLNITGAFYGEINDQLPLIPAFGSEVNNVSVKIADINDNGTLDWLLMGTDSGGNQLHYRIGWDLDTSGVPTSWSDLKTSPQIGGATTGGSAVATDLNGNGILDLLLLAVDSAEKHSFHYAVGGDIDNNGNPLSWSHRYQQGTNRANSVYVPLVPVIDFGNNIALSGRMFFPKEYTNDISADARLVWMVTGKTDNEEGDTFTTRLAEYHEDFMLTGFSATENYGTDGGLFYSENKEQTIAAGFVLAYEFLRTQAPMGNIPEKMTDHGIADDSHIMYSDIMSFPHQDAAIVGLTNNMTEDALDLLPEGQILPIIMAMEDNSASLDLSELFYSNEGFSYSADLRTIPITTAKMFRMNWFDTATGEPVQEGIITEMQEWGLEPDELENIMKLVIAWSAGDYTITRIGTEEINYTTPEQSQVLDTISLVFDFGLQGVDIALSIYGTGVGIYQYIKSIPKITASMKSLKGVFNAAVGGIRAIEAARVGTIANICKAVQWVNFLGDLLALGIAFYAFFDVAISSGWSEMGVTLGIWYFDLYLAYGLALVIIGCIPYVGWLIDLAIIISDAIGGWFSDFVEWFIGLFYEANPVTEVNIEVEGISFSFDDYEGNGLDVGDRVDLTVDIVEKVWTTQYAPYGGYSYFLDSYINTNLQCDGTNVSDQDTDRLFIDAYGGSEYDPYFYYHSDDLYQNYFWAEPNQAMVNFPWKIWVNYNYKIFYKEEFMGGWEIKSKTGSGSGDPFTIYLDVLPGNLDDFLAWTAITRLDPDGDGLLDNSGEDPNPNLYDTDGDGLSDGFEVMLGLNTLNADNDGDGLSDLDELRLGTDPDNADTDGDGLSDSEEFRGWDITFTYCGQLFTSYVSSDPLQIDTDGDGVSDYDEFTGPLKDCTQGNPRSQDTNGNGIKDSLNIVPIIFIDSSIDIFEGDVLTLSGNFTDPDPDIWIATVDYGDGSGVQPLNLNMDKTFTLNHIYTDNGTYTVTVCISDGSVITGDAIVMVTVTNVAPNVNAGPDVEVFLGQTFNLKAGFNDPGVNDKPWDYTIDWGDASSIIAGSIDIQGADAIEATHQYPGLGDYTVTVTVTDKDGGTGTDTLQVAVNKLQVKIEIKPGSDINSVNLESNGVIPVAILTDDDFDTSMVDVSTLRFGPAEAAPIHHAMEDVDHDGDADMIVHFRTQEGGLDEQDIEAILIGQTIDGIHFIGKDTVRIVPPNDKPKPPGNDDAPGQNKEPEEPADGKAIGKDNAPGQNKEPE